MAQLNTRLLQRRIDSAQRSFHRALHSLDRLQTKRRATPQSTPQARRRSPSASSPASTTEALQGTGRVVRLDPALDQIVPQGAVIEKLASGFQFTEGPLWRPQDQVLWFSDVVGNVVRQWSPNGEVKVLVQK